MHTKNTVGIKGYGAYIPIYRLKTREIAEVWGKPEEGLPVEEVSVTGIDEDSVTMATEAAKYALKSARIDAREIGAVYVGSESKPYAVKPSGTIVAEAIDAVPNLTAADFEFA